MSSTSAGNHSGIAGGDVAVVAAQLGRPPRSIHAVGHRCPCGNPDVVATEPRLDDGTPFPTTFYLTCPRAASLIGTLEASGLMREMTERLAEDEELAAAYRRAHEAYLAARAAIGEVPEIAGVSAGGMPDRVKCLHVLAGQSLAQGRGVNPLGDEVLDELGEWWRPGPCVAASASTDESEDQMTRVAAFDCGTNSLRLLIADLDVDAGDERGRGARDADRAARPGRRPHRPDRGCLAAAGVRRRRGVHGEVQEHDVSADQVLRDVGCSGRRERRGLRRAASASASASTPRCSTASEEARVSFAGATRDLPPLPEPLLVCDIGGGSTELILGDADGTSSRSGVARHRLGAAQRAPPRRRPAHRRGGRGGRRPTSTRPSTAARSTRPTPAR